jgi:hypothetical protein
MSVRRTTLALAAALVLSLLVGVQRADAATVLGSVDPSAEPEGYVCAVYACPAGKSVGFRQLALYGSQVAVDEPGVLVSARVNAKRIAAGDQPRIAVLKPAEDGDIGVKVSGFAPVPIVSADSEVHEVQDLHLPVDVGDSIGFLLPAGQVDLGTRTRRQPDGAVQWFMEPCGPCHMDGGTGRELLFDATIEPDADEDGLGDETQDPDFGLEEESDPLEEDEFDDWFDELDEDEEEEEQPASRRARRLRLLDLGRARNGNLFLTVGTPGAGRLGGIVTTSAGRWDLGLPRTIGLGESRAKRPAKVRLKLRLSSVGHRLERRPGRQRARIVVYHLSRGGIKVTMRQIRL